MKTTRPSQRAKRSRKRTGSRGKKQDKQAEHSRKTRQTKSPRQAGRKKEPKARQLEHDDFLTRSIDAASPATVRGLAQAEKRSLGKRILEAREMRGLTLEDLSSRSGIPVDALERVESNRAIPPLGELIRLGKALEMKMGYFISEGMDRPMSVVRSGSRRQVARRGKEVSQQYGYVYESLAPEKANRFMEPFLVTLIPTGFGELSNHDGQEFIFVLEGEIRVQVGKEVEVLRPGDSVYYDSFHPHLVKCCGNKPAKILAVIHAGAK
jgi:quercetin dioxygenase-like cupin family protein/ribosome-binding protein aMBF1 (putative translation factor)